MKSLMGLISTNYNIGEYSVLTEERPVASLPFGGRYRLIDFPLSNMVNSGISTVGLITPYKYRSLMDHVGVGKEWALNRKVGGLFILPGSTFGLKGAKGRFMVRDMIQNRAFIERGGCEYIVISDSSKVINIDYSAVEDFHEASGNDITIIYKKGMHPGRSNEVYLTFDKKGKVSNIRGGAFDRNNPNMMIGSFILKVDLLLQILDEYEHMGYLDMIDVFRENIGNYKIGAYEFTDYVGIISNLVTYMTVSMDLLKPEVMAQLFQDEKPIYTKVQDAPPVKYSKDCDVCSSLVSSGCVIDGTVENSIIFRDVHIAKGAIVRNCILMQHCSVPEGVVLEHVVCDKYVKIKPGIQIIGSPESPIALNKREMI